jgi:hypothetical protein
VVGVPAVGEAAGHAQLDIHRDWQVEDHGVSLGEGHVVERRHPGHGDVEAAPNPTDP